MRADRREESGPNEEQDQKTIRPIQSPAPAFASLPVVLSSRSFPDSDIEDYSDIAGGEDDSGLASKLANMKVSLSLCRVSDLNLDSVQLKNKARRAILHPDDLRKLKSLAPPSATQRSLSSPGESSASVGSHPPLLNPALGPPQSPKPRTFIPAEFRHSSTRKSELIESHLELHKYSEVDDEDYEDVFEYHGAQSIQSELDCGDVKQKGVAGV